MPLGQIWRVPNWPDPWLRLVYNRVMDKPPEESTDFASIHASIAYEEAEQSAPVRVEKQVETDFHVSFFFFWMCGIFSRRSMIRIFGLWRFVS